MLIAAPIWLLALIPWSALAIWMLWGRRERVGVPFLALWRDAEARPSTSRAVQVPPLPIILLLLTILFAILAASSPTLSRSETQPITVLVDRGVTMSARDGDAYRYVRAAELLVPALPHDAAVADDHGSDHGVGRDVPATAARELDGPREVLAVRVGAQGHALMSLVSG